MFPHEIEAPDESRWLLKALRESAHELESQLWGLDEDELRWRPADDAMSLKEIAAHMRDCEEHFLETLELIVERDEPKLKAFDGDALVMDRDYQETDLFETLDEFTYLRHRSVNVLWGPALGGWDRKGRHPYLGLLTITQLVRDQNEHDLEHLWQARNIRESLAQGAPTR